METRRRDARHVRGAATDLTASIAPRIRTATWLALPALGALGRVAPRLASAIDLALIASVGVSHGANDDRILARLAPTVRGGRTTISLAYGALAAAVFAAARCAPRSADRALSCVAWYHFGSGDVALARACGGTATSPLETFVRGAAPLAIARDTGVAGVLPLVLVRAAAHALGGRYADAFDVAIPAVTLAFAPVPHGFGAYFGAWHAPRHLALLLERDPLGGDGSARVRRFARESARNVALAFVAAAVGFVALPKGDPRDLVVALTLGVTVPHQLVVWYAERRARDGA